MVTIRTTDGWSYTLTPLDRIVLAVSAEYEGGDDPADVWWTYVQRLAKRAFRDRGMKALVESHSQPVNPIWRRDGSKCRPGGQYAGTPRCSPGALARRDEAAAKIRRGWSAVDPVIAERFRQWEAGLIPKRIGKADDFADQAVTTGFVNRNPGSVVTLRAGNWFVASPSALPEGAVRVDFGGRVGSVLGPVLFLSAVAGVAAVAWKRRKRR